MADLIPVSNNNFTCYKVFEHNYDECLKNFMSRIYPHNHEQYEKLVQQKQLLWEYIVADNKYIGSVWLEKNTPDSKTATLGIFICDISYRGKGIGEFTINKIINYGIDFLDIKKVELRVREENKRAFECYQKCGFKITGKLEKNNQIKVFQMEKAL